MHGAGQATRLCNSEGEWEDPNVLSCQQMEFMEIEVKVRFNYNTACNCIIICRSVIIMWKGIIIINFIIIFSARACIYTPAHTYSALPLE